jgi:hypothetical protein
MAHAGGQGLTDAMVSLVPAQVRRAPLFGVERALLA